MNLTDYPLWWKRCLQLLVGGVQAIPSEYKDLSITEHAEKNRKMPKGTPRPGRLDFSWTQYAVEPINNMCPHVNVEETFWKKPTQVAATMGMECGIMYYMGYIPKSQWVVSATDDLLERWVSKRLDPAIASYNYQTLIYAQDGPSKSRKSADKVYSKEYLGCRLDMVSAQSESKLRSDTVPVLWVDEVDGSPKNTKTGEGNWFNVLKARKDAFGERGKLFAASTPKTAGQSQIDDLYKSGDQRGYFVPCPHCKKEQVLDFGSDDSRHGLRPEKKAGQLVSAYYICEHCHEAIFEHHKTFMIKNGVWRPRARSGSILRRSYHLNSLYSPLGMFSWRKMYAEYEEAVESNDEEKMKTFTNLRLGEVWVEKGSRPSIDSVIELRGVYRSGIVPDGVLFLTIGADVQRGSLKDPDDPPRIELEVVGHGYAFRTWSIKYLVFEGEIDNPYQGAWKKLNEWAASGGMIFERRDGRKFAVSMVFIDSGDGLTTDVVYKFTSLWGNTFPCKGFRKIGKKTEGLDEAGPQSHKRFKVSKLDTDTTLIDVSTVFYKNRVYNNLKIERPPFGENPPGFCDFPIDYPETYFKGLTAEEKRKDGSFHKPNGRKNEPLDCRVYALCAGDYFLAKQIEQLRVAAKASGSSDAEIEQIDHKFVLQIFAKNMGVKIK